jgi:hypothetical protein
MQKDLIYSQYKLWVQYSPTALFVGTVEIICTILLYIWLVDIDKKTINKKWYLARLLFIEVIQFLCQYYYSVWKY